MFKPATKKQQGYFKSLTGEWLPRGTSMQTASRMIDKAKRGEIEKKIPVLRVYGSRLWSPTHRDHGVVSYVVDQDHRPCLGPFATFEQAQARAEAYGAANGFTVELAPDTVRELYVD
jgi:hypothetical protein